MNKAAKIGVVALGLIVVALIYARPRIVPAPQATALPKEGPPQAPGDPPVPEPPPPPIEVPPSVAMVTDALSREVDAGVSASRALAELLDQVEKEPARDGLSSKLSEMGGRFAGFHLSEHESQLPRCVDDLMAVPLSTDQRQAAVRSIRELGKRIGTLRKQMAPLLERVALLRAKPVAGWAEAMTGLDAELRRYGHSLELAETTAEAEAVRAEIR